jgi:hypothetical protein
LAHGTRRLNVSKRYAWLAPILVLVATACGGTDDNVLSSIDKALSVTSIDDACKALGAHEVNNAFGVTDIELIVDVPFRNFFNKEIEPGRECGYLNKKPDDTIPDSEEGIHGLTFSVSRFDDQKWKFDDADDTNKYWERVEIGDVAYHSTLSSILMVRNGDWVIAVLGLRPGAMTDEDFRPGMRDLAKRFVSNLPRH